MAITAKFEADFNQFVDETKKAVKGMKDLEDGANKVVPAVDKVNKSGDDFSKWIKEANKVLGPFGLALSAGALVAFGKSILDDADALVKMHDQTEISIEGLQAMRIAGDDAGVSLESMTDAVTKLQKRLGGGDETAAAALRDLGIEVEHFKSLDGAAQMSEISDAVKKMHDPLRVASDLSAVFGKNWAEILPALKRGFPELTDGTQRMSGFAVKLWDDIGDAIGRTYRATKAGVGEMVAKMLDLRSGGMLSFHESLDKVITLAEKAAPVFGGMIPVGLPADLDQIVTESDALGKALKENAELTKELAKIESDRVDSATIGLLGLSKMEQDLSQKRMQATVSGINEIEKAEADLNDFIANESLDSASYQILQIWRAADAKVAAFKGTTDQLAAFTTKVMELAAREANAVVYESDRALTVVTEKAVGAARAVQLAIQQVEAGLPVDVVGNAQAAGVSGVGMQAPIYVSPPLYARASGGPVSSGHSYLVGERGPEMFRPSTSGAILPSGGWGTTVHNTFYVNGTAEEAAQKIAKIINRSILDGTKLGF